MNVNAFLDFKTGGGTAERTFQMSRYLAAAGVKCTVLTIDTGLDASRISAMKPAEDGKGSVLRCYNPSASAVRGAWCVGSGVWQAGLCRLDETPLEPLEANDRGTIQFTTDARAVVTISVR